MRLKDDIYYLQQELGDIKQESIAMEMLKDYKKQNKRLFIISVMAILLLAVTFGYLVYTLNDIQAIEETQVDMDGHITAVIDGVVYDTFNPLHRIIRCVWRM